MTGDGRLDITELRMTVPVDEVELASDLLWGLGATAIVERDAGRRDGGPGGPGQVILTAGFADRVEAVKATELLDLRWARAAHGASGCAERSGRTGGASRSGGRNGERWDPTVTEVDDDSWLDAWRLYARPARAGARFVLVPAWQPADLAVDGDVVVRLDPGRQFGSGSHPSTRLVLAAVERLVGPATSVLDVGCGSGVLAVAAAMLGARPVVAVDVDRGAPAVAAANADRNGVGRAVQASTTPLAELDGRFSVVLANLLAPALVELAEPLMAKVESGGSLVLGGLLADRWEATTAHFTGWSAVDVDRQDGWVAVTLRREAPAG